MPKTRRLLHQEITYSEAQDDQSNILHKLTFPSQRDQFLDHVYRHRSWIQTVVSHHLNLRSGDACRVSQPDEWLHGSFNLCIPVQINMHNELGTNKMLVRIPLPYRIGEAFRPGNADEKLRCEAGTYAWMQQMAPSIRVPRLYGFGLSTGQCFTDIENMPFLARCFHSIRRRLRAFFGYQIPTRYVPHPVNYPDDPGMGYLLMEFIDDSQMLSNTWSTHHGDEILRANLFRDLSTIFLTLARVPLPRIGSFVIDENGYLTLSNRPLSSEIQELENGSIPIDMPRDFTYSTVDSYVVDLLACHDSRMQHQPNAAMDLMDGIYQITALTMMKALFPHFFQRELRRGPLILQLTDLHPSNIFVDSSWNIRCLIDLEWACSRPIEMLHPPTWLTDQTADNLDLETYNKIREEFINILQEQKKMIRAKGDQTPSLSTVMEQGWKTRTFWYSLCLRSPLGIHQFFYDHIQTRFAKGHIVDGDLFRINMSYWREGAIPFLHVKVKDKEKYDMQLREAFEVED
ncbi:hypothetical protein BO85DRAFT_166036 [Aspergillus piperis CBS 112811]|uniref:Aminoglycoside phosphotransferase domain-containing protein n=1 Tax=Aspergillus piperis CBS 112811 TaxID=1448313 RepID=A0A8G1QT07_9EURO|nr:hypothetical protein BO85DRAFT_166036 [Aspergillus piperis CBS 112811]RAH53124.1 hypothetical protein BO85DRAFT_166036 [Aspergillus piperis CBS 112811]